MIEGINDDSIDLTQEGNFRGPSRGTSVRQIGGMFLFPWNLRRVTSSDFLQEHVKRSYGDPCSDDCGATVRRTSTGALTFWGISSNVPDKVMLGAYFDEELGRMSDNTNYICPRCGKIYPTREIFFGSCTCLTEDEDAKCCNDKILKSGPNKLPERYVPWMDYILDGDGIIGTRARLFERDEWRWTLRDF